MSEGQDSLGFQDESAGRVDEFKFEPIKGYPMLNWRGKRPFSSTQFYPAQLREVHGDEVEGWRNKIFWGDNLQVMSHLLKQLRGRVDLIYIDPPFDSRETYNKNIRVKSKSAASPTSAFEEKQYSDLWNADDYLQFIFERVVLCRELLSDKGTLYLHCDWKRSHYIRAILDELFGPENCHNQISWRRSHAQGNSGQGAMHFGRTTDTILIYSKTNDPIWHPQYEAYTAEILERDYKYTDVDGEKYRLTPVDGPGGASKGNPYYEFQGVAGYWRYSEKTMQELFDQGQIVVSSTGKSLSRKRYLRDAKGTPVTDFWDDINRVSPTSNERVGYPTQKPEALLERIIKTSSDENSIVLDCFMGSGTTQAVAAKLGRRFVGADINLGAVQTTTKRLLSIASQHDFAGLEVFNVNNYEIFRNPVEAKDLLLEALEIQPIGASGLYDGELHGRMVKIMPVNRIATKADLGDLVSGFDQRAFQRRQDDKPNQPVEKILLVCMGHEPDLKAELELQAKPFRIDVEVVDILRDKSKLQFKRDSQAAISIKNGELCIENFFPMNLLQKLSLQQEQVGEWRELVDSVMVDWNYDGAILQPAVVDVPDKDEFVVGRYEVPADAGTIRVKITDLLSESWEGEIDA